jgi:hypothetical protein
VECPPSLATEPKQAPPARTVHDITRPDLDAASTLCDSLGVERLDPRATGEANDQQPVVNGLLNLGISLVFRSLLASRSYLGTVERSNPCFYCPGVGRPDGSPIPRHPCRWSMNLSETTSQNPKRMVRLGFTSVLNASTRRFRVMQINRWPVSCALRRSEPHGGLQRTKPGYWFPTSAIWGSYKNTIESLLLPS